MVVLPREFGPAVLSGREGQRVDEQGRNKKFIRISVLRCARCASHSVDPAGRALGLPQ